MKHVFLTLAIVFSGMLMQVNGQNFDDLDDYTVEEFYKKIELDYGTLDEDGNQIDFIFVKTEVDPGTYEIDISDGLGELYQINGTNIYMEFRSYYGYAGYSDECILFAEGSGYYSTLYKLE